ncbi:hypothetical protein rerp_12210 [Rhodococcus erythropolis]|nr:hypothetical protein rerp_12210 [Rhodococcus erythropolis]
MQVMAARVADRDGLPLIVGRCHGAGVVQSGFFPNREGVHVRTQQRCGARSVLQDSDDSGCPDAGSRVESQCCQMSFHQTGCSMLVKSKFRVAVEVFVQVDQIQIHCDRFVH